MGLWDIVYDIIKDYRLAKGNEVKRRDLAISICKKAYLRFNFEWTTEIASKRLDKIFDGQTATLSRYSQLFLDIAVEIFDTLPEESDIMKGMALEMKNGAYTIIMCGRAPTIPEGDKCAKEAMVRVGVLDKLSGK